ncbi:MAG: hypothetical protein CV081_01340 [Nitrospira sp. LK265]|nr:hypothetical protein [Nitrospira sp. LK265]
MTRATVRRASELRGLEWSDVDYQTGTLEFRQPKDRRKKILRVTPVLTKTLGSAKQCAGESEHVFPGPDWKQMTKDALVHRLDNIGIRAGIKLSSHRFRHTHPTPWCFWCSQTETVRPQNQDR